MPEDHVQAGTSTMAGGLRRRRAAAAPPPPTPEDVSNNPLLQRQAEGHPAGTFENHRNVFLKLSRIYCIFSVLLAVFAIVAAPAASSLNHSNATLHESPTSSPLSGHSWDGLHRDSTVTAVVERIFNFVGHGKPAIETDDERRGNEELTERKLPPWLRWLSPLDDEAVRAKRQVITDDAYGTRSDGMFDTVWMWIKYHVDPLLLKPNLEIVPGLIDKITKSPARLFAVANLFLAMTFILHGVVADLFLGEGSWHNQEWSETTTGGERFGGFLVFKFLLIAAVVSQDSLDLIILLGWYTTLSFLRSLSYLCNGTTRHTIQSGQSPRPGVLTLLTAVLFGDCIAASFFVALFHGTGPGKVLLMTCDCVLLALDVFCHATMHVQQVVEARHGERISQLEAQRITLNHVGNTRNDTSDNNATESGQMDTRVEDLEQQISLAGQRHIRLVNGLDTTVYCLQLLNHFITVGHFGHIWIWNGFGLTLLDGVLALQVHSTLTAASKSIAERRELHRIAHEMNRRFEEANEMDVRKAAVNGDVCCICLVSMTVGNVKKLGCCHLYHTNCLRQVIEKARSMEAARCPMCRAPIINGRNGLPDQMGQRRRVDAFPTNGDAEGVVGHVVIPDDRNHELARDALSALALPRPSQNNRENNGNGGGRERALFRFSTEGIFPGWLPLPAFSFEVVRRPAGHGNNDRQQQQAPHEQPEGFRLETFLRRVLIISGIVAGRPEEEEEEAAAGI